MGHHESIRPEMNMGCNEATEMGIGEGERKKWFEKYHYDGAHIKVWADEDSYFDRLFFPFVGLSKVVMLFFLTLEESNSDFRQIPAGYEIAGN